MYFRVFLHENCIFAKLKEKKVKKEAFHIFLNMFNHLLSIIVSTNRAPHPDAKRCSHIHVQHTWNNNNQTSLMSKHTPLAPLRAFDMPSRLLRDAFGIIPSLSLWRQEWMWGARIFQWLWHILSPDHSSTWTSDFILSLINLHILFKNNDLWID